MNLESNTWFINQIPALSIAETYGTPLYVYDGDKIISQYQRLKKAFTGIEFKIKYACKANNNINILKLLNAEGCGLDTVSIQEVYLGIKAGYAVNNILYTPNCVSIEEIKEAAALGVRINIDNISILEQFGHL